MERDIQTRANNWKILFISLLFVSITRVYSGDPVDFTVVTDAQQKGAVCLDGSPAIYFHNPGAGDGVNNWIIVLGGGGWCRSDATCADKIRLEPFASSKQSSKPMIFEGLLSSNQASNPEFYNWNKVWLHYCDGGSFLGDSEVVTSNYTFQLRGSKIFDAVMGELLAKGMAKATNALFTGGSAGGLGAMLHCDIFAALIPKAKVKCLSDAGFFIRAVDLPYNDYRDRVYVQTIEYRNLTTKLPVKCTSPNASLCFYPENFAGNIKTPLFILNSAYDSFQIHDNLQPASGDYAGWRDCTDRLNCKPSHKKVVMDFRKEFLRAVEKVSANPATGVFISSCYVHGFFVHENLWSSENAPKVENKTVAQAIRDWYFDRSPIKIIDPNEWLVAQCGNRTEPVADPGPKPKDGEL